MITLAHEYAIGPPLTSFSSMSPGHCLPGFRYARSSDPIYTVIREVDREGRLQMVRL